MATRNKKVRSRILSTFQPELMEKIKKLVLSNKINDINEKVDILMALLDEYDIDYSELGTGTNRTAIFIDGYVFKIALDKWGIRDNKQEFILSEELQPYVIKVYETNGVIMVCEYVVVINKEEFAERKPQIRRILAELSNEYLLGDIGTINKNFANWGYRDNDELVALDYAYIYRIIGNEMKCDCGTAPILSYTPDFDELVCPHCRKRYRFMDVRRRITKEREDKEVEDSLNLAYKVKEPLSTVKEIIPDEILHPTAKSFEFGVGEYLELRQKQEDENNMSIINGKETMIDLYNDDSVDEIDDLQAEIEKMRALKEGRITVEDMNVDETSNSFNDACEEYNEMSEHIHQTEIDDVDETVYPTLESGDDYYDYNVETIGAEVLKVAAENEKLKEIIQSVLSKVSSLANEEVMVEVNDVSSALAAERAIGKLVEQVKNKEPEVVEVIKEVQVPKHVMEPNVKSLNFELILDSDLNPCNIEIEPENELEENIKKDVAAQLVDYINVKGIGTKDLDLNIDLTYYVKNRKDAVKEEFDSEESELDELEKMYSELDTTKVKK